MLILISCGSSCVDRAALKAAATDQGRAAARVSLPPLPDDCRIQEPHAEARVGVQAITVLKRERSATNRANARVLRCADNYENVASALK
jgi:hypothetical protein